ncbi:tail fiber protein, partial [Bifidobacterium bifidum]
MTLDGFRDVTETPISLDFSNSWIADIRLNAGDKDGRTITVAITDNGQPITSTTGIKSVALAYNTAPGVEVGDRVPMSPVSGEATATYRATLPQAGDRQARRHRPGRGGHHRGRRQGLLPQLQGRRRTRRLGRRKHPGAGQPHPPRTAHRGRRRRHHPRQQRHHRREQRGRGRQPGHRGRAHHRRQHHHPRPEPAGHVLAARQRPAAHPRPVHPARRGRHQRRSHHAGPQQARHREHAAGRKQGRLHADGRRATRQQDHRRGREHRQPLPGGGRQHVHRRRGRHEPHPRHPAR